MTDLLDVPDLADLNFAYAPPEPANSRGHLLDLYRPGRPSATPRPLLIWSGGSAWLSDDGKASAIEAAEFFVGAGWVVAGVSVRSSGQAHFPAQLHDVKSAIRWLRNRAGTFGIDESRIAVMGDSSGGWLASMAALTANRPELEGAVGEPGSSMVRAAVDLYGPTDFQQMDAHMLPGTEVASNAPLDTTGDHGDAGSPESLLIGGPIGANPERVQAANPLAYARPDAPRLLIVHGEADPVVPHHQSELLFMALASAGADATFISIPDNGHEHPYLEDEGASRGRIVRSTRKPTPAVSGLNDHGPTWSAIEVFLREAMG